MAHHTSGNDHNVEIYDSGFSVHVPLPYHPHSKEDLAMAELGTAEIMEMTKDLNDSRKMIFQTQYSSERKDRGTAVILALFMYDRIWLGDTGIGILKLVSFGGCGIWWLVDLFSAGSRCDDYNRQKAQEIAAALRLQ